MSMLPLTSVTGMEINDANLAELLGHLQKTLSPDGATRMSGNEKYNLL